MDRIEDLFQLRAGTGGELIVFERYGIGIDRLLSRSVGDRCGSVLRVRAEEKRSPARLGALARPQRPLYLLHLTVASPAVAGPSACFVSVSVSTPAEVRGRHTLLT
jgi:hypothetical protein